MSGKIRNFVAEKRTSPRVGRRFEKERKNECLSMYNLTIYNVPFMGQFGGLDNLPCGQERVES